MLDVPRDRLEQQCKAYCAGCQRTLSYVKSNPAMDTIARYRFN